MTFTPTHVVPQGGLPAWHAPDGSQPVATNLHAGTEIRVTERRVDWAHVEAANGWAGWVDARRLVDRGAAAATAGTVDLTRPIAPGEVALPPGLTLSTAGKRFGAFLLETLLFAVTLGIGWLVWALIVFGRGQTPAKQLLDMRVMHHGEQRAASWGRMFLREIVAKQIIGFVAAVTLIGVILYLWLLWDKNRQQVWDKIVDTVVVDDPTGVLTPM